MHRCYLFVVPQFIVVNGRYAVPHQNTLPQQQQHLLHWEMGCMTTAELGNHTEEHDRNGLVVEERRSWVRGGRGGNSLLSKFLFISML